MPDDVEQPGQVPDTGTQQAENQTTDKSDDNANVSDDVLKKVRQEAAANRVKAKELEAKVTELEAAKAKQEAERDTMNAQMLKLQAQAIARDAATDAVYPDLVASYIDIAAATVDGQISEPKVREQITTFRGKYPAVFRGSAPDAASKSPAKDVNLADCSMEDYARIRNSSSGQK